MPWLCFDELGCAQDDFEMKLPVSWARSMAEAQHTVVLTDDGNLFATGKGDFGRLGRGDTNDEVWRGCWEQLFQEEEGGGIGWNLLILSELLYVAPVFWMWKTFFLGIQTEPLLCSKVERFAKMTV